MVSTMTVAASSNVGATAARNHQNNNETGGEARFDRAKMTLVALALLVSPVFWLPVNYAAKRLNVGDEVGWLVLAMFFSVAIGVIMAFVVGVSKINENEKRHNETHDLEEAAHHSTIGVWLAVVAAILAAIVWFMSEGEANNNTTNVGYGACAVIGAAGIGMMSNAVDLYRKKDQYQ